MGEGRVFKVDLRQPSGSVKISNYERVGLTYNRSLAACFDSRRIEESFNCAGVP